MKMYVFYYQIIITEHNLSMLLNKQLQLINKIHANFQLIFSEIPIRTQSLPTKT